jgi:hypothetical protein
MNPGAANKPVISVSMYFRSKGVAFCTSSTIVERPSMTKFKSSRSWLAKKPPRPRPLKASIFVARKYDPDLQIPGQPVDRCGFHRGGIPAIRES